MGTGMLGFPRYPSGFGCCLIKSSKFPVLKLKLSGFVCPFSFTFKENVSVLLSGNSGLTLDHHKPKYRGSGVLNFRVTVFAPLATWKYLPSPPAPPALSAPGVKIVPLL